MRYAQVCVESFGYTLPDEIVPTAELEAQLRPLYERLRLPEGRLELMTGIRERRFWRPGELPSTKSILSARQAMDAAGIDPSRIGALIHGSVCRDHLEPATACAVHHGLGLPSQCVIYDVSNACLGLMNGMVQIANMIELGQIEAGLVVGCESARPLVETTIARLNSDTSITRSEAKLAMASLTIGSGSAAVLLTHRRISQTGNKLSTALARSRSSFHRLCHSGRDEAVAAGMHPLMTTDSERLMHEGIALGSETFLDFLDEATWSVDSIDKVFTHQVGVAHRKLMQQNLGLPPGADFSTVEFLGNTGSVALPITAAMGIEQGRLQKGDNVALLGIGSGINVLMLAVQWQRSLISISKPNGPVERSEQPLRFSAEGIVGKL